MQAADCRDQAEVLPPRCRSFVIERWAVLAILAAFLAPAFVFAQEGERSSRQKHAWGRFEPGAWKRTRLTTELLDAQQLVVGVTVTETTTTLVEADERQYLLRIDTSMEVADRRFNLETQWVRRGYQGETESSISPPSAPAKAPGGTAGSPSRDAWRASAAGQASSATPSAPSNTQASLAPRLMNISHGPGRGGVVLTSTNSQATIPALAPSRVQTKVTTLAANTPVDVLGASYLGTELEIVNEGPEGVVTTIEWHVPSVPGGVVSHLSEHHNPSGQLVRRSTLELSAYGATERRWGLSRLLRWRTWRRDRT